MANFKGEDDNQKFEKIPWFGKENHGYYSNQKLGKRYIDLVIIIVVNIVTKGMIKLPLLVKITIVTISTQNLVKDS